MNKLYYLYINYDHDTEEAYRKYIIDYEQLRNLTKQLSDSKLEFIDINPCEVVRHEMLGENDKIKFEESDFCSPNDNELASYREDNGFYFIGRSNHYWGINKKKIDMYDVYPFDKPSLRYKMESSK